MMKRKLFGALILLLPLPAWALCVGCSCTVSVTGGVVSFSDFNPFGSNVDATGNVRVTCSSLVTLGTIDYSIAFNKGLYSTGFNPRQMGNGAYRLNYNLYSDSGRTTIWGDGGEYGTVTGSITLFVLIDEEYVDHTVYGRIPGPQATAHEGDYSDTIHVTVTYD